MGSLPNQHAAFLPNGTFPPNGISQKLVPEHVVTSVRLLIAPTHVYGSECMSFAFGRQARLHSGCMVRQRKTNRKKAHAYTQKHRNTHTQAYAHKRTGGGEIGSANLVGRAGLGAATVCKWRRHHRCCKRAGQLHSAVQTLLLAGRGLDFCRTVLVSLKSQGNT